MCHPRRHRAPGVPLGLLLWILVVGTLPAEEYVERISSFETGTEANDFLYDAGAKGWAKVSSEQASDGKASLKLGFFTTEAEISRGGDDGLLAVLVRSLTRSLGIASEEDADPGKLAQLGCSQDTLPFDWTGADAEFTFLAGSDTKGGREVIIELIDIFAQDDPRFMLYAGDALHTGGFASQWDRWFQAVEPFASGRPVMQSTGNHELGGDPKLRNWQIYTAFPDDSGNAVYYSFDYGPVHFVCLDTDSGLYDDQLAWLEKDLAATPKPRKVAYFHRPVFSSGTVHGSNQELRDLLAPVFSKHHVNLVLSGHDHLYERSKPIDVLKSKSGPVGSYKEGTCYVISGGAGAGLYDAKPGNWWTAALNTTSHHFCRFKVAGSKSMTLQAVDRQGKVIDSVTLEN